LTVIIGISITNYKNFTFRALILGLVASFFVIALLSFFVIYTKIGRKIDKDKTRNLFFKDRRDKPSKTLNKTLKTLKTVSKYPPATQ
jgi:hypothetical protein